MTLTEPERGGDKPRARKESSPGVIPEVGRKEVKRICWQRRENRK
jgi:hypothetical protein